MRYRRKLHVWFEGVAGSRAPVCVSSTRKEPGPSVTVFIEREWRAARTLFLLHRLGLEVVIAASIHREPIDAALAALGSRKERYAITEVPLVGIKA